MTARIQAWWSLRSPREQRLLLVMAALFVLVFAWIGIIRPLGDGLADAQARHGRAIIALAAARDQADAIRALERGAVATPAIALPELVDRAAREAGFPAAVAVPDGNGARLTIPAVRAQAFFGWVADVERRYGLVVDQLTVRTNADATLAVEVGLRGRGA